MARKKAENKKWLSRPSREKRPNRNKKPSKIQKNNLKLSNSAKPSRQNRKKSVIEKNHSVPLISLEEKVAEEIIDARIVHNFLSERFEKFIYDINLNVKHSL